MANGRPYFALKQDKTLFLTTEEVEKELQKKLQAINETIAQAPDNLLASERTKNITHKNSAEKQIELMNGNPEEYTKLYNLQLDINSHVKPESLDDSNSSDKPVAEAHAIKTDENGNLSMKISLLQPAGVSMAVVDGRVQFSPDDMTPDKMLAMIDFLQRHGLVVDTSNLKLENAESKTQQLFDKAKEKQKEAEVGNPKVIYVVTTDDNSDNASVDETAQEVEKEITEEQLSSNGEPIADEAEAEEETEQDEHTAEQEAPKAQKKEKKKKSKEKSATEKSLDALNESVSGWMNKNRTKGLSWYEGSSIGGWKTFTSYTSESTDPFRKPITIDPKTKEVKCNYEFKIYTRINKDGKLEIAYSLPPGKNLTDDQAYLITSALKDAGVKRVNFGKMSDTDDAIMRGACAKRAIVPLGHKINAERFDKMIKIAGQKLDDNSPELYRYKYDLAMQMKNWLEAKGKDVFAEKNRNNPDCRRIRWAIGAYQMHPFRDLWEDFGLRGDFEKAVAKGTPGMAKTPEGENNGAAQVIGATMAVVSLHKIYDANMGAPLTANDLLNGKEGLLRTEKERNALRNALSLNGDRPDTNIRDLSPRTMRAIYQAMCETETIRATADIDKRYLEILKNNKDIDGKGETPEKAVSDCLNNARARIEDVNGQLEDCELKKIYLTRFSLPRHDFSNARKEALKQGLIKPKNKDDSPRPQKQQHTY